MMEFVDVTYLEQVMRRSSLLRIHLQSKVQEITEDGRQVVLVFDGRRAVGGDQIQGPQGRFRKIRRLTLDHLDGHDTQTPDINLTAILLSSNDFRGHPIRCTDHGVSLIVRVIDLGTETEIGYFTSENEHSGHREGSLLSLIFPSIERRMLSDLISR